MKKFITIFAICWAGIFSHAEAQDRVVVTRARPATPFKCVTPTGLLKGVACYTTDVGKGVLKGVGKVIAAPFKARICIPKPRIFRWKRGYWVPNRFYEVPNLKTELLKTRNGVEENKMRYLPYFDQPEMPDGFLAIR